MTSNEHELILKLVTESLPKDEFLAKFRESEDGSHLAGILLDEAIESRESEDVEYALMVGFTFGFCPDQLNRLVVILSKDWHHKHEDVVTALGQLAHRDAIEALYQATQWIPDYLDFDESRALGVKAIWALGRIEGHEAEKALTRLGEANVPILSDEANRQITRRTAS